jgi:hypothetical protein
LVEASQLPLERWDRAHCGKEAGVRTGRFKRIFYSRFLRLEVKSDTGFVGL